MSINEDYMVYLGVDRGGPRGSPRGGHLGVPPKSGVPGDLRVGGPGPGIWGSGLHMSKPLIKPG